MFMWDQVSCPNRISTIYLFTAALKQLSHMALLPICEGPWQFWNCDWFCIYGRDNGIKVRLSTVYKAEVVPKYVSTLRNGRPHHSFESNFYQGGEQLEVLA